VIVFDLDVAFDAGTYGMSATPRSGYLSIIPGGFCDLVLLCETAGCKMEQKKDTIISNE
jgi:hypothetical protein